MINQWCNLTHQIRSYRDSKTKEILRNQKKKQEMETDRKMTATAKTTQN